MGRSLDYNLSDLLQGHIHISHFTKHGKNFITLLYQSPSRTLPVSSLFLAPFPSTSCLSDIALSPLDSSSCLLLGVVITLREAEWRAGCVGWFCYEHTCAEMWCVCHTTLSSLGFCLCLCFFKPLHHRAPEFLYIVRGLGKHRSLN